LGLRWTPLEELASPQATTRSERETAPTTRDMAFRMVEIMCKADAMIR
jgi:hypothetical protein